MLKDVKAELARSLSIVFFGALAGACSGSDPKSEDGSGGAGATASGGSGATAGSGGIGGSGGTGVGGGGTGGAGAGGNALDWEARIAGPGVVWHHDFDSDAEVNAFRWTPAYGSGNDPLAVGGDLANLVRRVPDDGVAGDGCLEIVRPPGSDDGSVWWRPFSPIVGTGNGRGVDDPGANGTIEPQPYLATDGGNEVSTWGDRGYYGKPNTSAYDGGEYFLQVRVKMDPARIAGGNEDVEVGKLFYFTRTDRSATDQEIVVYSGAPAQGENYLRMYRSVSPALDTDPPGVEVHGNQPGTELGTVGDGVCRIDDDGGRLANCWHWPAGEWATVMWHVRPGESGNNDTLVETYVANPGETSYTKIWNQPGVDLPFDPDFPQGHNALIASIYHNGENMPQQFFHRYDQLIFSKEFIPCPVP
jgi:hypothetical protein